MYISSFLTLDTALSGVEAAQEELDTTGQNIANQTTPSYEEQIVNLVESESLTIHGSGGDGAMQLGTGVDAVSISNSGDPYLDAAWRQQNAATNAADTTQTYTQQIQTALNEPSSTGINEQLATFWSDWNDLVTDPNSESAQQAVVSQGEEVAQAFNNLATSIQGIDPSDPTDPENSSSILGQVNDQYEAAMEGPAQAGSSGGSLYNIAYNIAQLNTAIVQATAAGQNANDLIDQRSAALDQLSALGNTQVVNNSDGSVSVYFGGVSTALVDDPSGITPGGSVPAGDNFGTGTNLATPDAVNTQSWMSAWQAQFQTAAAAGTTAASLANTVGGTLGSLIGLAGYSASGFGNLGTATYDTATGTTSYLTAVPATEQGTIGGVMQSLNTVAADLAQEVNAPVVTGTGDVVQLNSPFFVNGTTGTVTAGTASGSVTAANLAVASSLASAAAGGTLSPQTVDSTTPAGGNTQGTTNVQVSSLATATPTTPITVAGYTVVSTASNASDNDVALDEANNSGGVADSAYQALVQQIGSLAQGANDADTTNSALQTQITNQRDSVEGVDLSQEMSNLITEQQSYQASARVMNAFSTVMDSLMTVVGQ